MQRSAFSRSEAGLFYDALALSTTTQNKRPNQDRAHADSNLGFILLADGMGGHAVGEEASELAKKTIAKTLNSGLRLAESIEDVDTLIDAAVSIANSMILTKQLLIAAELKPDAFDKKVGILAVHSAALLLISRLSSAEKISDIAELKHDIFDLSSDYIQKMPQIPKKARMGTTLSAAVIREDAEGAPWVIARNIGDSRIYYLAASAEISQMSRDDSFEQDLIARGSSQQEARDVVAAWNLQSTITAALGRQETYNLLPHQRMLKRMSPADAVLAVSDGVWRNMIPERIQALHRQFTRSEEFVRLLIEEASRNSLLPGGKHDDITAAFLKVPVLVQASSPVYKVTEVNSRNGIPVLAFNEIKPIGDFFIPKDRFGEWLWNLTKKIENNDPHLFWYHVRQIINHLVLNSFDACQMRSVSEREPSYLPRINVEAHLSPEGRLRIVIEDNGIGINPEGLKKIMQTHFTTKKGSIQKECVISGSHGEGMLNARDSIIKLGASATVSIQTRYDRLGTAEKVLFYPGPQEAPDAPLHPAGKSERGTRIQIDILLQLDVKPTEELRLLRISWSAPELIKVSFAKQTASSPEESAAEIKERWLQ
ncbi:MAG: ATP-binding protein, partial [Deltaproteobacteria bacterium]